MKLILNNEESALNDLVEIAEQKKEEINTQLKKRKLILTIIELSKEQHQQMTEKIYKKHLSNLQMRVIIQTI